MFDWDDLRIFLAAARASSATGAAQQLGLDPATVGRRIRNLETALKSTLFTRSAQGLELTSAGAHLMATALDAEAAMARAAMVAAPNVVAGTVRLSASEGFGAAVLAAHLPTLRRRHPHLSIELIANPGFLSPAKREVDMVVTLVPPDSARLAVEPLTDYELGLYAAGEVAARLGPVRVADLKDLEMVGYVADQIYAPALRYLEELGGGLRPALASTSVRAQREIIAAGGGVGVLPCFIAEGLTRLAPDEVALRRRFWIAIHQEVAGTARIRAVSAWLRDVVVQEKARLLPGG